MTHFIDAVLGPALWSLADWSLRWAVLVGVLAVALRVFRPRRAATRHLLCLVALLAGVLAPVVPRWGAGWDGARDGTQSVSAVSVAPEVPQREPSSPAPLTPGGPKAAVPEVRAPAVHPAPVPASEGGPPAPGPVVESWGWRRLAVLGLSLSWGAGVPVLLVRCWCGWRFLRRLRQTAVALPGPALELFDTCRAELGVRRSVRLLAHARVRSPVLLGLWRPVILVPPHWPALPPAMQRAGLLHELAHLKRGDDWLTLPLGGVRVFFFYHPFVRWLLARLERERELLCDEMAVRRGIDPRDYAAILLEFARQAGRFAPLPSAGLSYLLPFGRRRTVKARIHHLLEENMGRWIEPPPARRAVVLGVVLLIPALGLASYRLWAREPEKSNAPADEGEKRMAPAKPAATGKREALRYGGKNFDQWRVELVTELKPAIRADGLKALGAFGANGYGPEATTAVLEMMRGYDVTVIGNGDDDFPVMTAAARAIDKIGPAAVPILQKGLQDESRNVRRFAATALGGFGTDARAAVPALLPAIEDKDPEMRRRAINAVAGIDKQARGFVPALIGALKDERSDIRAFAAETLGEVGREAEPAVPGLAGALKDTDGHVRSSALTALEKIGAGATVVGPVSGLLRDRDSTYQIDKRAYAFLTGLGPKAVEAVPALIAVLKGPAHGRFDAIWALAAIGPEAKEAVPVLTELLRSDDKRLASEAAAALKKIAPQ